MGFSVSGSAALVFVGLFIAFGMFHTAAANSYERVSEAEDDRSDRTLAEKNTAIEITNASHDGSTLYVTVNNTGAAQLTRSDSDLLVDGAYETGWAAGATVDGDGATDLWLPGQQLVVELDRPSQPNRVKVVTDTGVSDAAEVTAL